MSSDYSSPLWMVADQPALNGLVAELRAARRELESGSANLQLRFSRAKLQAARDGFGAMIRRGEEQLHKLCELLADQLLEPYEVRSVVIGEVQNTGERFSLAFDIDPAQRYGATDLDLGNRQLDRVRISTTAGWVGTSLISNVVEYGALAENRFKIHKLLSRIKAEEEIWNKVVDEIFDLDALVLRDKSLRHLSRFVKDVFGIKIVVDDADAAYKLQSQLACLEFSAAALTQKGLNRDSHNRTLEFVEVKDYLKRKSRKHSGWMALKSVIRWNERTFELQVQPLLNFLTERELLTRESHAAFKGKRDQVRSDVARGLPLFGFYLELLRWLFVDPCGEPPRYGGLQILLDD